MVFKDFKDKIRFLRTFKNRAIFFRNLRTSGRPVVVTISTFFAQWLNAFVCLVMIELYEKKVEAE